MRVALFTAALLLSGCAGYHIGPIKPSFMKGVDTIAVLNFKNETLEPRVEILAADILIKQLQEDGTFRIESPARADAILEGTISKVSRRPARSVRGNVLATREFTFEITLDFKVTRRSDDETVARRSVTGQTSFFVSGDINQDERQAIPLAMHEAAVKLVSIISEGW